MTGAVDIGREACERLASWIETSGIILERNFALAEAPALILALRAALDAAERERDAARRWAAEESGMLLAERHAADAAGYARGVRDAAAFFAPDGLVPLNPVFARAAILALLPKEKEPTP
jgi:hypothetical protein